MWKKLWRRRREALVLWSVLLLAQGALAAPFVLTNGTLEVTIRDDNGAIQQLVFAGHDFYATPPPVANWGLQNDEDFTSFVLNQSGGGQSQAVMVAGTASEVTVTGTYLGGGANVSFQRVYRLLAGSNVLRVETLFTNNGASTVVLRYFDTFNPDPAGTLLTFNDVVPGVVTVFGTATAGVARANVPGVTVVMGAAVPGPPDLLRVASGFPFQIADGFQLNALFDAPVDGGGAEADQGTHVAAELQIPPLATRGFNYRHAYALADGDALSEFAGVPACNDGGDNDGDGFVDLADPGCSGPGDFSERDADLPCDNGLDDDGDLAVDYPADLGCALPGSSKEDPQCQDGINNDPGQDMLIDFDGGDSAGLPVGQQTLPDPQCTASFRDREGSRTPCGLGFELALALAALATLRRRRR